MFNSVFGQTGFKQKMDSLCEITFPNAPQIKTTEDNTAYYINKTSTNYIVLVQYLAKKGIGPAQISIAY